MRAFWLFILLLFFNNADVLHITAPEDYIFVFVGGCRNKVVALPPVFSAKGEHMFECDGGLFWIDVMKNANVAAPTVLEAVSL